MKRNLKNIFLDIVSCLLIGIIAFSGFKIFTITSEDKKAENAYKDSLQFTEAPAKGKNDTEDGVSFPQIDFSSLKKKNPDIVGWIYVEGTEINYPVVQANDNSFYLKRLYNGEQNRAGSIFMDCSSNSDLTDKNTVIYGHNMKNGSMFADLAKYKDKSFYENHKTGYYLTPEKIYTIKFFSGYVSKTDSSAWNIDFPSDSDYNNWQKEILQKSLFKADFTPNPEDKTITLSTCSYEFNNARFVLAGVLS